VRRLKQISLVVLAAFYVLAGVNHFLNPDAYEPMMPPYLPAHRFLILASGVAEVALGVLVLPRATRRWAAFGIIALLFAVLPANVHIAIYDLPLFGAEHGAGIWNWVRVAFQGVLIAWAWWHTKD
jgi:uncharacterized membrane protein